MSPQYLELTMTALLVIVVLYTALGGMISVLVTDYLQFLVMGLGLVVVSVAVLWDVGGLALPASLREAHRAGLTAAAGDGPAPLAMAEPFNPLASVGPAWVAWQALVALAGAVTWQTTIARVLSARDASTAKAIYRRTSFFFVGRFCLPALWGAGAFLFFWSQGGLPEGLASRDAMPVYLSTLLPMGLLGLVVAAMLAAEMSTDAGYLLCWATVIYNDLICPCLRRPLSPRSRLLLVRSLVVAIGLFLLFYGLWYEIPGRAFDYITITGTTYLAGISTLVISALYWRRANRWGAYLALVLSVVGPMTFLVLNRAGKEWIPAEIAGLAAFALSAAGMVVGSLAAPKGPSRTGQSPAFPRRGTDSKEFPGKACGVEARTKLTGRRRDDAGPGLP